MSHLEERLAALELQIAILAAVADGRPLLVLLDGGQVTRREEIDRWQPRP